MRLGPRGFFRILLVPAAFYLITLQARAQTSVWIDTDPAMGMFFKDADDSLGLAYALKSPRLRVEGISVTYGNASMPQSLPIVKSVVEQFAANPKAQSSLIYTGALGRGYLGLATDATVGLQLALNKKRLIYVALGPLTNLATLLETRPALAKNIDQVIWVAGRPAGATLKIGDTNPLSFHDSNFEKDPQSAALVLAAKIPMTLVSRELAGDFLLTRENQTALSNSNPGSKWLAKELDHWLTLWKTGWNIEGGPMLDVVPFLAIGYPSSLQSEPGFVGMSMDLNKLVPPKAGEVGKYLLVAKKSSPNQDRPVTYIRDIDNSAKENWLKVMTGK